MRALAADLLGVGVIVATLNVGSHCGMYMSQVATDLHTHRDLDSIDGCPLL